MYSDLDFRTRIPKFWWFDNVSLFCSPYFSVHAQGRQFSSIWLHFLQCHLIHQHRLLIKVENFDDWKPFLTICFRACHALQGHPRSLILAPIKSAYATSYWSSIVTLVLYCPVSEILQVFCREDRATPPLFHPHFRGVLLGLDCRCCGSQERIP